jgi:hypothetical protein
VANGTDSVDDGHEAATDGAEDALDARDDGTHIEDEKCWFVSRLNLFWFGGEGFRAGSSVCMNSWVTERMHDGEKGRQEV